MNRSPGSIRLIGLLSIGLSGGLSSLLGGDWPQFLGPNRNGQAPGILDSTWPTNGPAVRWQRKVGAGFAGPVVVADEVILFHRVADEEVVECFKTDSGQPEWRAAYPSHYRDDFGFDEGPRATPAVSDGRIYTFGAEGRLYCWNLTDGKKIWSVDTKVDFRAGKGFFGVACSPLVEGAAVILNVGGTDGAGVVAFDRLTGKVLWKATDDPASYSSPTAATIADQRRILVVTREALVGLNPTSGKIWFRYPWRPSFDASVSAASPIVDGDKVFLSASYGTGATLLRLGGDKPEKLWQADDVLSNHYATSVLHDGFLYGFDGRQEQGCALRCVELAHGKVRWSVDGFGAGTVTLVGNKLLILTEKGELVMAPASPESFKPSARSQVLPFGVRAYPAFANGRLYARSKDKLACLDLNVSHP